jgi:hypothetical protein
MIGCAVEPLSRRGTSQPKSSSAAPPLGTSRQWGSDQDLNDLLRDVREQLRSSDVRLEAIVKALIPHGLSPPKQPPVPSNHPAVEVAAPVAGTLTKL